MLPRLINRTLAVAGGALALFHGWLFVSQAAAGRLGDPWVIFRWLAAGALIAALMVTHRRGHVLWGRKAIALWLLAAFLHGPSMASTESVNTFALPEAAAASVLQLAASAGVAVGLWLLASLLAARRVSGLTFHAAVSDFTIADHFSAGHAARFSPRPPPLRG